MRIAPAALSCVFAIGLAACQSTTVQTQAAFNPAEAAFIKKEGTATIEGHAFLRRKSGANVYAAGEVVRLTPVTPYASERFAKLYNGRKFVTAVSIPKVDVDPVYASYTRTVKSDHMGRFRFENVAPGRYYFSTQAIWRERGEYMPSGGAMYDEVTVSGKEERPVDVILSGN